MLRGLTDTTEQTTLIQIQSHGTFSSRSWDLGTYALISYDVSSWHMERLTIATNAHRLPRSLMYLCFRRSLAKLRLATNYRTTLQANNRDRIRQQQTAATTLPPSTRHRLASAF
jgi:hypothetical protein